MLVAIRFSGDPVLEACLDGSHRMLAPERGAAVGRVQQALSELGYDLSPSGVDSQFGDITGRAVSAFKVSRGISPSDPVVGPNTMAELDSIFQDLLTPPPAAEDEIGGDPYGRRPSAAAKVPEAQAVVQAFLANPAGSTWLHLDRLTVGANISSQINAPDVVQQGGNGVCATASFVNLWVQDAPDAYARFATALFDRGSADLAPSQGAGLRIAAGTSLRGADYGAIAAKMLARGLPAPSQADWMVMSAIRDSSNSCVAFTGDPDDMVSHYLGDGADLTSKDLVSWMNGSGTFSRVVNEVDPWLGKTFGHAAALDPSVSRCVLVINTKMFTDKDGYHAAVLRSRAVLEGGNVRLRLWSWGRIYEVSTSVANFDSTYYGATIGYL